MYNRQNFTFQQLGTASAYYRVKGVASERCPGSVSVGLIGTQAHVALMGDARVFTSYAVTMSTVHNAGTQAGSISWDQGSVTEEGLIK